MSEKAARCAAFLCAHLEQTLEESNSDTLLIVDTVYRKIVDSSTRLTKERRS